jgi:hypothetical protein
MLSHVDEFQEALGAFYRLWGEAFVKRTDPRTIFMARRGFKTRQLPTYSNFCQERGYTLNTEVPEEIQRLDTLMTELNIFREQIRINGDAFDEEHAYCQELHRRLEGMLTQSKVMQSGS